jgi:hypothetical protein
MCDMPVTRGLHLVLFALHFERVGAPRPVMPTSGQHADALSVGRRVGYRGECCLTGTSSTSQTSLEAV